MPAQPRVGFITGSRSALRASGLAAKHAMMRARGVVLPDVYSLPYFLGDRFDFIRDGTPVPKGKYDVVFTELNRSEPQLAYIERVMAESGAPVVVIPGPPELLAGVLDATMTRLVRGVLERAALVLAYSETVRQFCDGLLGEQKAVIVPWPFDADLIRRLAGVPKRKDERRRILLNVPLRFTGVEEYPFVHHAILRDALAALPPASRNRLSFHTFTYTDADRELFRSTGYAAGLPVRLERKRGFPGFVRLVSRCDAVVNLTSGTVLGRITFIAGALRRPGVFSENAELNRALYPYSTTGVLGAERLRDLLEGLVRGAASGDVEDRFYPDGMAVEATGDREANALRFRELVLPGLGL